MNDLRRAADWLKYYFFCLAASLVIRVPAEIAYVFAAPLGALAAVLTPRRRRDVIDNLSHVRPEATSRELARLSLAVYANIVRYYVDLFRSPLHQDGLESDRVRTAGLEHLSTATAAGRGVIVATIHYGALELALQAAARRGFQFLVITERLEPAGLSDMFTRLRAANGHEIVPAGFGGLRSVIRKLRAGGSVLVLADRDIQHRGVSVPFFGSPTRLPAGAVELARLTGAPIIVAVSTRLTGGRAEVRFEPPFELKITDDRMADLQTNVARLAEHFERYIRRAPQQWLVLERIWGNDDRGSG